MKRKHDNGFPSRDAIVAFIRANPGKIGTREIAREFGLKNAEREAGDEVFDIGLNRAVTLIAEKIAKGPSGRRFGADPGKPLGEHPSLGGVAVKNGRYGAYVTAGGVNATIPSDKTPETITLAEAIALLDERAAKGVLAVFFGAAFFAPRFGLPPPLAARSSISAIACASVIVSGAMSLGMVALTPPAVT